ncbi:AfsR/SARP family transcriptional regulator [Streptomyces xiamenensis]
MQHHYRVLGTVRVFRADGTEIALGGGRRLRALLAALAVAGGRPVAADALVARVWWEDAPPAEPVAAVQALVGRLRRVLGAAAVESVPGGYRLAAGAGDIDLFRFAELAEGGAAALGGGDARRASVLLEEALALWAEPVLAELPGREDEPLVAEALRRYGRARRDRLAAEVALGRPARALGELAELTAAAPLDEPLHALRIRALLGDGRPAEALGAYEEARAALAERLGTDPGPELRALYTGLLGAPGHAAATEPWHGARPAAGAVNGARAAGHRQVGRGAPGGHTPPSRPAADTERRTPGGAVSEAVPREGSTTGEREPAGGRDRGAPGGAPGWVSSFVGRETELREVREALAGARLVTLLGPGGVGKTRLALEAVAAPAARVRVVELAGVRDGADVAEAVLQEVAAGAGDVQGTTTALGGGGGGGATRDPLRLLVESCARRRLLLVLDNCEHVRAAATALAEALLTRCPGVTVLATSREPLGLPGETVLPVGPLPPADALRLFGERGAAARPGFGVQEDPAACAEICRRLDGLPLALELAAARLRAFTPRELADRLDRRFVLLGDGGSDHGGDHSDTDHDGSGSDDGSGGHRRRRTLRAVVDWSWDLLTEAERTVLRRLSVFSGGCAFGEAEAVCGADTLGALPALVDKSLLTAVPEPSGGGTRYRLLETVAQYAAERLTAAGERDAIAQRHLHTYRELARAAEPGLHGPRQAHWMARLTREHDNIRTAVRHALDTGQEQEALCLVLAMSWFWRLHYHLGDFRSAALGAAELGPDPFTAPVRHAAPLSGRVTDLPPPWDAERRWEARRQVRLLLLAAGEGEYADPERLAAVIAAYRPGLPQLCGQPGQMWYFAKLMAGEYPDIEATMAAMLADCRRLGSTWDLGCALLMRATLLTSVEVADEALERLERTGDPLAIAQALWVRGDAWLLRGRQERAVADFGAALEWAERSGTPAQVPLLRAEWAAARLAVDPADAAAERELRRAVADAREFSLSAPGLPALLLAEFLGRTGRPEQAREPLRALAEDFSEHTPPLVRALWAGLRGWLDCQREAYGTALEWLREAVELLAGSGRMMAPQMVAHELLLAAWARAGLGGHPEAALLLGAYDRYRRVPGMGFRPMPTDPALAPGVRALVRAGLPDAVYEERYAAGAALTLPEAIAVVTGRG